MRHQHSTPAPAQGPGPLSPEEVTQLNSYELMIIMRPDAIDEARAAILDRVREIIASEQGTVGKTDEWGKRRFAYEIAHLNEGYYYVMYFKAAPATLDEVTRVLKISDNVLRVMPVRLPDKVTITAQEAAPAQAPVEAAEDAAAPAEAAVAAVEE